MYAFIDEFNCCLCGYIDNSSSEYVTTADGSLVITARAVKTAYTEWDEHNKLYKTMTKNYTSGMVQSWNKFCFTGGILEMSIELPGEVDSGGLHSTLFILNQITVA